LRISIWKMVGDVRNLALTPYAKEIIDRLDHIGPFLIARKDGKPYTNKNLNAIWREACEKAGIKIKLYNAIPILSDANYWMKGKTFLQFRKSLDTKASI